MRTSWVKTVTAVLLVSFASFAQKPLTSDKGAEFRIKKQILVHSLDNQIKDVTLAAPRVLARYKIAKWLWKDGKDDIGRAEDLAVGAVDDLFRNRREIPAVYFDALSADLFALLTKNLPRFAKTIRDKYNWDSGAESSSLDSMLGEAGGEKLAVDAATRSLTASNPPDAGLSLLAAQLRQRRSPELLRLLDAIVSAEEVGRIRLIPETMVSLTSYYAEAIVPIRTSRRFVTIVMDRSRTASQMPTGMFETYFDLLNRNMPTISERCAEILPEANVVLSVLQSRLSQQTREARERDERINNSSDKLAALIAEAENAKDSSIKYEYYKRAARTALKDGKFKVSVDLIRILAEIDMSASLIAENIIADERNQLLEELANTSLKARDDKSCRYAVDTMSDLVRKSQNFGKIANFYVENSDLDSARASFDLALRFAENVEDDARRASVYFALLAVGRTIDPTSVFEINRLAAKSVDMIPALNVEDKPGTENYKNYVTKLMIVNWNLAPALTKLIKVDRRAAADLASRIERKEIKIIADCELGFAELESERKQSEKREPAR